MKCKHIIVTIFALTALSCGTSIPGCSPNSQTPVQAVSDIQVKGSENANETPKAEDLTQAPPPNPAANETDTNEHPHDKSLPIISNDVQAKMQENTNETSSPVEEETDTYTCDHNETIPFTREDDVKTYIDHHESYLTVSNTNIDWKTVESTLPLPIFKTKQSADSETQTLSYLNHLKKYQTCHIEQTIQKNQYSVQLILCAFPLDLEYSIDQHNDIYMTISGSKDGSIRTYLVKENLTLYDGEAANDYYESSIKLLSLTEKTFLGQPGLYVRVQDYHESQAEHMGTDIYLQINYNTYLFAGDKFRLVHGWTDAEISDETTQYEDSSYKEEHDGEIAYCFSSSGRYFEYHQTFDGVNYHEEKITAYDMNEMKALMNHR